MGLIARLRALPKKWLITVIALFAGIVASVAVLVPVLILSKSSVKKPSFAELSFSDNAVFEYVMGDDVDLSGIKIVGEKNGVKFSEEVSFDMLVLPESGVDKTSGLNRNGMFLDSGSKHIALRYDKFELGFDVEVEEDYVVSISFAPNSSLVVVENSNAIDALGKLNLFASTFSGRNIKLSVDDVVANSAYSRDGDSQMSLLRNGKIIKTNTTVYSQSFVLGVGYNFVYGENLPARDGAVIVAEFGSAQVVDRNVESIATSFGSETNGFYKSVASRSDFAGVLPLTAFCTYDNGQKESIFFTDGKYLFEIVSTADGIGYSFVKDDQGNPVEFSNATKRESYFVWYYFSENEFENKTLFLPFGASYEVENGKPSSASWLGSSSDVFVPTENSVFLGSEREQVILLAELSYDTRKGEIFVEEVEYGSQRTTDIDYDEAKDASKNLRVFSGAFFVVVDENGDRHYCSKESFSDAFGLYSNRKIYFNNFGFADESLVEKRNDYYYLNGDLVEVANITEAVGYFDDDDNLVGFALDRYYVDDLILTLNEAQNITVFGGDSVEVELFDVTVNGFILKLSGLYAVDCTYDSPRYLVRENKAVAVEAFGEQSDNLFVGDLISLDGFGFVLTLENGDKVVLNQDKTARYFEEDHTWSNNDFVCFGSDWQMEEAKSVFDAEIKSRTNNNRACFAFVENNADHLCVYVGALGDKDFDKLCATVQFDVEALDLISVTLNNSSYVVSGGNHFYDDTEYLLKKNVASLVFNGSSWNKGAGRDICEVVFANDEETYSTFKHKYGNPNAFAGNDRAVVLVASISDEIVDGQLGYISVGMWGHYATCSSQPITLVRSNRDVVYGDISVGGVLVDGNILGFGYDVLGDVEICSATNSVNSSFDQITQNKMSAILGANNYGDYVIENAADTVWVSFSFEQNNIKTENSFEILRADYFSVSDGVPNALYANGAQLSTAAMCDYYLYVNLLSRDDVLLGRVSDFEQSLVALDNAPSGATTAKTVRMRFDDGNNERVFSSTLSFFENVTETFDKLYDFEKVFASETGLEKLPESGSYGVYRRVNFDSTFAGYVSTKINNYIGSAFATTGVRFENQANAGLGNVAVLFDSERGSYYVLAGGKRCYVEGFDFVFEADGRYFSRVVVPSGQGKRVLYVEINESADFGDDDYFVGVLADAKPALVLCVYDESDNLVWSGTTVEDLRDQILTLSTSEVAGNYVYSKIYVQATSKLYGEGDDFEYVVESDKIGIEFFDVPHVTNGWADENSMLVEHQALSLVPEFGSDVLSATLEENYDRIYSFPAIEIEYTSASGSGRYAAGSVLNKNLRFLPFESQGIAGEIGYSVSAYGNTIILGDYSDIGYVRIRMQYLGMEFAINMPVCKDFVLLADYERRSFLEGSLLADNSLRFLAENCTMASGRKLGDLQTDEYGNVGEDYVSLIVVKHGYDRFVLRPNELYKVIGDEYELLADANRLFSYSDGYTYTTYALTIQPSDVDYSVDSPLFAAAFGNWSGTGFGKGDALASSKLTLSSDKLASVELDNIKTNYVTDIASIGLYDYFSFGDARFVFESGLEFVCPANKLSYLVARNGEIVPTDTALSTDIVLRKFELSFGERVRATGNVEVASAVIDSEAVDVSLLSFDKPVRTTMQVVFSAGGINERKNVDFSYVKPDILRIDVVYSSSRTFDEGTVLSKNDIASYVESATIVCRNAEDIVLSRAQFLNLYLQHGDNYLVQNNGTSIYVTDSEFRLSDLVFGLTKAEDEMSDDEILELSFKFVEVEGCWGIAEYIGSEADVVVPSTYRGESVVEIGNEAFDGKGVESILIPATIRAIGMSAFYGCSDLETVLFDENSGLVDIGYKAFVRCSKLKSITLPASVTEFGGDCFAYCTELDDIVFETTSVQAAKDFCDELSSYYTETLWVKSAIFETVRDYVVDQEYGFVVKEIGSQDDLDRLFDFELNGNNEYVITKYKGSDVVVKIPESYLGLPVVEIGPAAFIAEIEYYKGYEGDIEYIVNGVGTGVVRVDASSCNLKKIDAYAFAYCDKLKNISFGDSLESIEGVAFGACSSLTSVFVPASVRSVSSAFETAKEGQAPLFPAFVVCEKLEQIVVDPNNPWFDSRNDCNAIIETTSNTLVVGCKTTIIPATVAKLANYAFFGSGVVRITIPANVESIGETIEWIDLEDNEVTSGGCVFAGCKALVGIEFETTQIETIPYRTFGDCISLERIVVPYGVRFIEDAIVDGCDSLVDIVIPETIEKIDGLYNYCENLENIWFDGTLRQWFEVDTRNNYYADYALLDGLNFYCGGYKLENVYANDLQGIETINSNLAGCASVVSIALPQSVTNIDYRAFKNCRNLASVSLPNSVTAIGFEAFAGCESLERIVIPASVLTIERLFADSGLVHLVVEGTSTISARAIEGCSNIEDITLQSDDSETLKAQCYAISQNQYVYENSYNSVFAGTVYVHVDDSTFDALESYMNSVQHSFEIVNGGGDVPPQPSDEDFEFSWIDDDKYPGYKVVAYNGSGGAVVIPSTHNGFLVRYIGNFAFKNKTNITSATIPDSVIEIDEYAFENCTGLTSVTLSNNLAFTSIYVGLFEGCTSLDNIVIPQNVVTLDWSAFSGCSSLRSITLPNGLKTIGMNAFEGCTSLETISIPSSVTEIEEYAFSGCSNLESFEWPAGAETIVQHVFYGCEKLSSLTIVNGVTTISGGAFVGCENLKTIDLPESVTNLDSEAFAESYLENIILRSKTISFDTLCSAMHKSSFSGNLYVDDSIYDNLLAYKDASETYRDDTYTILKISGQQQDTITFGSFKLISNGGGNGWIVKSADVTDGTTCTVPENYEGKPLLVLARGAVDGDTMTVFDAGNSNLTTIEDFAFLNAPELTTIILPESVTSIGENAFDGCPNLETIVIDSTDVDDVKRIVGFIGATGFAGTVEVAPEIAVEVFEWAKIQGFNFNVEANWTDDTVLRMFDMEIYLDYAVIVSYHGTATNLVLPTTFQGCPLGYVGKVAKTGPFKDNADLVSVYIPKSVLYIGNRAFEGCSNLKSVTFEENSDLDYIGDSAFEGCTSLLSFSLPSGFPQYNSDTYEGYFGERAFYGCTSLNTVNLSPSNLSWIRARTFDGCSSLTSITIPASVTSIGSSAFFSCSALTSITIPASVTSIGESAFDNCRALATVTFEQGSKLQTIGGYAFFGCDALKSITIPASVTSIGELAFCDCNALIRITIPSSVGTIGGGAFRGCTSLATARVPRALESQVNYAFDSNVEIIYY